MKRRSLLEQGNSEKARQKEYEERISELETKLEDKRIGIFKEGGRLLWKRFKGYKDPLLFLILDNGEIKIIENVQPGELEVKTSDKKTVISFLDPKRMLRIPDCMGGEYRCFILHEREMSCYPHDVINDVKQNTNIYTELRSNYKQLDLLGKIGMIGDINVIRKVAMIAIVAFMLLVLYSWYAGNPALTGISRIMGG